MRDAVEMYPMDPNPPTVESRFAEDKNPAVWRPIVVEMRAVLRVPAEMYPAEPNPSTVEVIFTKEIPPGPNAVEKEEIADPMKFVVEINEDAMDAEEMYPMDPNPPTVEYSSVNEGPVELIVTTPVPPTGLMEILVPATIWLTPAPPPPPPEIADPFNNKIPLLTVKKLIAALNGSIIFKEDRLV